MKTFENTDKRRASDGKLVTVFMAASMAVGISVWAPASFAVDFGEAINYGEEFGNAVANGEFHVNLRYRYEFVEQSDNGKKDANASTLRTRLVYRTAKWNDFDVTVNMDDLRPIVGYSFNDTRNGKTDYQTVADPKGTDLNIAALTYSGLNNTTFVLGRQRITRGDHRFIGNVGWRQNEQTYDGFSANFKDERFKASYAYIDRVKRIFGPEDGIPAASFQSDSHILDAAYTLSDALTVSVYGYLLDFKNADTASNQTFGIRIAGKPKINDDWSVIYAAEFASQEDYGDNPTKYDTDYVRANLGFRWQRYSFKAGYELLGSDKSATTGGFLTPKAFQTPLSTLHAMNGWADKFLSTPIRGLEDVTLTASAKLAAKGILTLVWHEFSSDTGGVDYGTELDFVTKWPLGDRYSVLGKLAFYDADKNAPAIGGLNQDTNKVWVMMSAAF